MKGDINMRFNFDECELINSFLEIINVTNKEALIEKLDSAKVNTADSELITIADNTIKKLYALNEASFQKLISNLPVDSLTIY